jgi:hypothetical protein
MRDLPLDAAAVGLPGRAPFLVLEGEEVAHHEAAYEISAVIRAFVETGAAQAAPELTRAVLHVMRTAEPQGVTHLVRHVSATAATMGLILGDEAAWQAADHTYPWTEAMTSAEYWNQMENSL